MSYGSATDFEGLMMGKNIIIIEGLRGKIKDPYKRVLIQVEKNGDLKTAVKRILDDGETQKKLKRRREEYLRKSFYKVDGKAYKRVADLIASLIKAP